VRADGRRKYSNGKDNPKNRNYGRVNSIYYVMAMELQNYLFLRNSQNTDSQRCVYFATKIGKKMMKKIWRMGNYA